MAEERRRAESVKAEDAKLRRSLASRKEVRVERTFLDGMGDRHQVKSVPVPGGRHVYDHSPGWGFRDLGFCGGGEDERSVSALANDYADRCSDEKRPLCRRLQLSDIKRGGAGSGHASKTGGR